MIDGVKIEITKEYNDPWFKCVVGQIIDINPPYDFIITKEEYDNDPDMRMNADGAYVCIGHGVEIQIPTDSFKIIEE